MDRRDFLRALAVTGGAAALGAIPGCHGGSTTAPPTGSRVGSPSPSPTGAGPPTDADWAAFGSSLDGTLVQPGDAAYAAAHRLFNPRFDGVLPAGIAYCGSAADVQRSIAFVRAHGLPIAARSGGHSYAGYSTGTGLVCDVTAMHRVTVDGAAGTATVGAGARLIDLYAALAPHGVCVPGGSCPTVGIAGLTLGGGQGVVGRRFGLTCDVLTSLQVVSAAGDLLTCDTNEHADLFWACRGGGGGNFGIATSFTFDTNPLTTLTLFFLHWPWSAARDVVLAWQDWAPHAPNALWSNCHLLSNADRSSASQPTVSVGGAYVGTATALSGLLDTLQSSVGSPPTSRVVTTHDYLDAMLVEAGCSDASVAACHLPGQTPQGSLAREASVARSDFYTKPLPSGSIDAITAALEHRQADARMTMVAGVALDAFGGAINRVAPDATAFVHRDALFLAQYNATWPQAASAATIAANTAWLNDLYTALRPAASGFAYQNYIDPALADWEDAFYGSNLARLRQVTATYDPDGVFAFAQGIR
jgi:FAD/FMN-containing dehydrogenase